MSKIKNRIMGAIARKMTNVVTKKNVGGKEVIVELLFVAIAVGLIVIFREAIFNFVQNIMTSLSNTADTFF